MRVEVENMVSYKQISLFDFLNSDNENEVVLKDICEFKNGKLHEYEISITYSDTVLLISMLHDYVGMLENLEGSRIEYCKMRFSGMAEKLETCIDYNYAEKLEKCKLGIKEKDDRLSENWIGA